jgi:Utp11 protein
MSMSSLILTSSLMMIDIGNAASAEFRSSFSEVPFHFSTDTHQTKRTIPTPSFTQQCSIDWLRQTCWSVHLTTMSSMRNAVTRRPHKERSQPESRAKWGLLEKHKVCRFDIHTQLSQLPLSSTFKLTDKSLI